MTKSKLFNSLIKINAAVLIVLMISGCRINFSSEKGLVFENDSAPTDSNTATGSDSLLSALSEGYCLNKDENNIFCWGSQIRPTPVNIAPDIRTSTIHLKGKLITQLETSNKNTCVVDSAGIPYCWGEYQSLGSETNDNYVAVPTPVDRTGVLSGLTVKSLKMGTDHACVIASSDEVYCWGINSKGQLGNGTTTFSSTPVKVNTAGVLNSKTAKKLYVFNNSTCVIANDDKMYCWGEGIYGMLGNGASSNSSIPVAVSSGEMGSLTVKSFHQGNTLECVIASDDKVYCWGRAQYAGSGVNNLFSSSSPKAIDFSGVLSGKTAKNLIVAGTTACILASDDKVYCWGSNARLALGNGTSSSFSAVPTAVSMGSLTAKSLANSGTATCIIAQDDLSYCWGDNSWGQFGDTTTTNSNVAVATSTSGVLSGKTIKSLYGHSDRTCVIASDDKVYCWGYGELGDGTSSPYYDETPRAVLTSGVLSGKSISKISMSQSNNCVLTSDQKVYCWGENQYGELGTGATGRLNYPVATVDGISNELIQDSVFTKLMLDGSVCAQRSSGEMFCGFPGKGLSKLHDFGAARISKLEEGDSSKCVLTDDGAVYCWGQGYMGQLGDGQGSDSSTPVAIDMTGVLNGKTVKDLTLGQESACVIASDDLLYCWGAGSAKLIGNGSDSDQYSPAAVVMNGKKAKSVHIGNDTACMVADDDLPYCWGHGSYGGLGDGVGTDTNVPVAVSTSGVLNNKKVKSFHMMRRSSCVIADDNLAYCWGNGTDGQLGQGATANSNVPVAVDTSGVLSGKTVKKLSGNGWNTCLIASDDKAYCFGYGMEGQLGNNASVVASSPVLVTGSAAGKTIIDIKVSSNSGCAVDSDEDVYCWGDGTYGTGEIGDGSSSIVMSPVKLSY